jgi:hypothetical protein
MAEAKAGKEVPEARNGGEQDARATDGLAGKSLDIRTVNLFFDTGPAIAIRELP